ncbi:histidine kinase [Streptomyces sp. NBC_00257]|nr:MULTISPECIES: histidine kinase [unclassified Streptomyces]MCX4865293.1 histidine kinase [Streptomyces sp. NBC_00906]MCX4896531.1 histidine kinase [Streptomyces sp. NBC_00892]MCX5429818.1 histidine kinase [Streptomyces sp. NBC_00062]
MWWALPASVAAFFAGREPGRTGPTVLVLVAVLAGGVVAVALVPSWLLMAGRFVAVVAVAAMLPWFAGRFWRQYQELVRAGWERAGRLEREQRLVAEQARSRERARIAQDMHDVLGHDLSLIALSAGALKLAPGLDEAHRAAAGEIRARAAASVERLGEVIGLLREEAGEEAPQPSGTGIARLVEEAAAAGLPVVLRAEGEADGISPAAARAAHRVVQEALTNAAKHAPGARVDVRVTHAAGETTVRVENGPPPAPARAEDVPGTGRGLIGLDERVRLAGGEFTYGPHGDFAHGPHGDFTHGPYGDFAHGPYGSGFEYGPHGDFAHGPHGDSAHGPHGGGFAVTARIPHTPPAALVHRAPATPRAAPPALPPEHRHARSRARRALAVAVVLPLVAWALLSAALMAWDVRSARLSVLDPGDYARLRVGQDRESVGRLLPDRETRQRPVAGEPRGEGITCRYYAMTADRFDDRSGDAYRLCFRDGRLMSKEALTP